MCKDFIGASGQGNCKDFNGKPLCYVTQPSSCSDLQDSQTNPGEKFSFTACSKGGMSILSFWNVIGYIDTKMYKRYCTNVF